MAANSDSTWRNIGFTFRHHRLVATLAVRPIHKSGSVITSWCGKSVKFLAHEAAYCVCVCVLGKWRGWWLRFIAVLSSFLRARLSFWSTTMHFDLCRWDTYLGFMRFGGWVDVIAINWGEQCLELDLTFAICIDWIFWLLLEKSELKLIFNCTFCES